MPIIMKFATGLAILGKSLVKASCSVLNFEKHEKHGAYVIETTTM